MCATVLEARSDCSGRYGSFVICLLTLGFPRRLRCRAMKLLYPLLFLVACAGTQKEVSMQGSDLDLARVAGDWQGEYKGTEPGRTGSVSFSLAVVVTRPRAK